MKIKVLAIGELLADIISLDNANSLGQSKNFKMFQGGSPANFVANLNYLGTRADLVACVGNDSIGNFLIDSLKKLGISGNFIQKHTELPSSIVLVAGNQSTPEFIAYRMADKYIPAIPIDLIESTELVHTDAFALSKEPASGSIISALKTANFLGKSISIDWNYSPAIWESNNGLKTFMELTKLNPLFKLSLDDFSRFSGIEHPEPNQAIEFLSQFKLTRVCITCGADGVWFMNENKFWENMPAKQVKMVDSTGAGDAFWAGYLHAQLKGLATSESVQTGIELASRKIEKLGPLYLT